MVVLQGSGCFGRRTASEEDRGTAGAPYASVVKVLLREGLRTVPLEQPETRSKRAANSRGSICLGRNTARVGSAAEEESVRVADKFLPGPPGNDLFQNRTAGIRVPELA